MKTKHIESNVVLMKCEACHNIFVVAIRPDKEIKPLRCNVCGGKDTKPIIINSDLDNIKKMNYEKHKVIIENKAYAVLSKRQTEKKADEIMDRIIKECPNPYVFLKALIGWKR